MRFEKNIYMHETVIRSFSSTSAKKFSMYGFTSTFTERILMSFYKNIEALKLLGKMLDKIQYKTTGLSSLEFVSTCSIFTNVVSIPLTTRPKIVCFLFKCVHGLNVMKLRYTHTHTHTTER